jgi:hypothetical protein
MIETAAKSGHLKGLKQALAPPVKMNQYRDLSFSVKCSATPLFPLGDSMVIFHVEGERTYKSFSEKDERVEAVYLPLSPTHVLVGHCDGYEPDLAVLPLAIAQCPDGPVHSCAIITTEPNDLMKDIHDRMPVILGPGDYSTWLDPNNQATAELKQLLKPYPAAAMAAHPVSPRVNPAKYDDPALIRNLSDLASTNS